VVLPAIVGEHELVPVPRIAQLDDDRGRHHQLRGVAVPDVVRHRLVDRAVRRHRRCQRHGHLDQVVVEGEGGGRIAAGAGGEEARGGIQGAARDGGEGDRAVGAGDRREGAARSAERDVGSHRRMPLRIAHGDPHDPLGAQHELVGIGLRAAAGYRSRRGEVGERRPRLAPLTGELFGRDAAAARDQDVRELEDVGSGQGRELGEVVGRRIPRLPLRQAGAEQPRAEVDRRSARLELFEQT
jgi:hypothetical protein